MEVSDDDLKGFRKIYRKEHDKKLSIAQSREMAERLINLYNAVDAPAAPRTQQPHYAVFRPAGRSTDSPNLSARSLILLIRFSNSRSCSYVKVPTSTHAVRSQFLRSTATIKIELPERAKRRGPTQFLTSEVQNNT